MIGILFLSLQSKAQNVSLDFIGFFHEVDTVTFTAFGPNSYKKGLDTILINVPANEVWVHTKSVYTWKRPTGSYNQILGGTACNCLQLDGMVLINIMNSEGDFKFYNDADYLSQNSNYNHELGSLSLYSQERIFLEQGVHEMIFDATFSGNAPFVQIDTFFEKYTLQ